MEEELQNAYKLIRSLVEEIDYKNHKMSMMQQNFEETTADIRKVVVGLTEKVNFKDRSLLELEEKYQERCANVRWLMREKAILCDLYGQEIKKLKSTENKLKKRLEQLAKELEECRAQNDFQRGILVDEIEKNKCQETELEQLTKEMECKTQDDVERRNLQDEIDGSNIECQGKEFEQLTEELAQNDMERSPSVEDMQGNSMQCQTKELEHLTKELDECKANHDLERGAVMDDIEKLEGNLQTQNHEIDALRKDLEEKEDALQYLESLCHTLMTKESRSNHELHDARQESISGLQHMLNSRSTLGIKRMGEVDQKAFQETCLLKFPNEDWQDISAKLCSLWEDNVKDSLWHPFKKVVVKGQLQEIIDDDNEKLKGLRDEYGEVVYKAVTNALLELNEYNPSGRFAVPEVWNLKEGRRASMKEIIQYMMKQLKSHKRKRRH